MPSRAQSRTTVAVALLLTALGATDARAGVACDRMLAWTLQVQQEHPDQNLTSIPIEKVMAFAMPLFNDVSFAPVFGRTYDRLSDAERAGIWSDFRKCQQTNGMGRQLLWQGIVLQKPFATGSAVNQTASRIRASVIQARAANIQISQLKRELDALPANATGAQRLEAIDHVSAPALSFLWPSEAHAFASRLAAARSRMTGPTVAAHADSVIAAQQRATEAAAQKHAAAQQQLAATKQAAAQKPAAASHVPTGGAVTHTASTAHGTPKGAATDAQIDALADSLRADMDEDDHDEPTAKEMYYVLESQMKIQEANTEAVLKRCETGDATSAMQMACSLMKAARGNGAGASLKLVSLEKVGCDQDEGYVSTFDCDYNAEYSSTNPSLEKMLELGGAQLEHGTFAWSKGKWTKLEDDQ